MSPFSIFIRSMVDQSTGQLDTHLYPSSDRVLPSRFNPQSQSGSGCLSLFSSFPVKILIAKGCCTLFSEEGEFFLLNRLHHRLQEIVRTTLLFVSDNYLRRVRNCSSLNRCSRLCVVRGVPQPGSPAFFINLSFQEDGPSSRTFSPLFLGILGL